jgi:hypothetical protein
MAGQPVLGADLNRSESSLLADVRMGSNSVIRRCLHNLRITPESGRRAIIGGCLKMPTGDINAVLPRAAE